MTARAETVPLNVRVTQAGMAALDAIAAEEGADRSTVVRALLAEALQARQARKQASRRR
jgi:metal-responsive CopG/Arc/MetJ family transcriptional regulator